MYNTINDGLLIELLKVCRKGLLKNDNAFAGEFVQTQSFEIIIGRNLDVRDLRGRMLTIYPDILRPYA